MRTLRILMAVVLAAFVSQGVEGQEAKGDEAAARKLSADFTAALNKGDGKAAAALFAENGDYISSTGRMASGRAAIEKLVADQSAGAFKGTSFKTTVESIRPVTADVMIGNGSFEASGAQTRKGMTTIVAVRQGEQWRIAALRAMAPTVPK